ncbi:MAG: hypothetical protein IKI29_00015 [Clostridia bacterium]|nr:hypothetical protein [Clostridia bacterium]
MLTVPFMLLVEGFFCNILFRPDATTDMGFMAVLLLIINSVATIVTLSRKMEQENEPELGKYVLLSFVLRILVLLWDYFGRNIFVLPNSEADAVGYHNAGMSYAFGSRRGKVDWSDYSFYLGYLYRLFGIQKMTAQFINVYLTMCTILFLIRITKQFHLDETIRRTAIGLMCFLPNSMLITCFTLQEALIAFLLMASLSCFTKWFFEKNILFFVFSILISLAAANLHIGGSVTAVIFLAMFVFLNNPERKFTLTVGKSILAIGFVVLILIFFSTSGSGLLKKINGKELSAENIVSSTTVPDAVTDADYVIGFSGLPPVADLVVNSPIRIFYFVSSPPPWMWRGPGDIIAFFGSALFYLYTIKVAYTAFRDRKFIEDSDQLKAYFYVLVGVLLLAALMFGWAVSNTGTALRHREKYTCMCALLFAFSQEISLRAKENKEHALRNGIGRRPNLQR